MSVLRDFMDKLTPAAQTEPSCAPAHGLGQTLNHITSITPIIIILVFGFQQCHRGTATAGPPASRSLFMLFAYRRTATVGKGGRDARGPGSLIASWTITFAKWRSPEPLDGLQRMALNSAVH